MSQKENEFVSMLKNLDKQLTDCKKYLKSSKNVNNTVPSSGYSFLIWATQHLENEEILELLINSGANVNNEHDGYTPLLKAIGRKSLNKTKLLLSKGANINHKIQTNAGDTPLTFSIWNDNLPITEYLIEQGADVNLIGNEDQTPLSLAVDEENVEIVQLLIANGAIVDKPDGEGRTPLAIARENANEIILELLENPTLSSLNTAKSLTDTIDSEEDTRLVNAIRSGKTEIVKRFLKSKLNVCKRGKNGKTPLLIAVETGNSDVVKLLLENGAEHTIQSALFEAIRLKNLEIVKILLEKGAILDIACKEGWTPLTKAIEANDLETVKVLVENGADVNMPQRDGTLPLILAFKKGYSHIAKYLINNFGQFRSDSTLNFEPLLKHIEDDNFEMVQMLVEMGTSLSFIYNDLETPLSKAVKLGNYEIVKYLVKKGADVNQVNGEGKAPLALAASIQDIRIVKCLISRKARLDLAKEEIEEYAKVDDDLSMYLDLLKKESCSCAWERSSFQNAGQEAAD